MEQLTQKRKALIALESLIQDYTAAGRDLLPTEKELISSIDVGRNTLRSAIGDMEHKGILQRIQGKGTFIRSFRSSLQLATWTGTELPGRESIRRLLESFRLDNAGSEVVTDQYPYHQYIDELVRRFRNGREPDVFQLAPYQLMRFHRMGYLRRLDSYLGTDNMNRRFSKDVEMGKIGDGIFGLNLSLAPLALFYHKGVMASAGLDPSRPPVDFNELLEMSEIINRSGSGRYSGIALPLSNYIANVLWSYPVFLALGGGFVDAQGNLQVNSEVNIEALRFLTDLQRRGGIPGRNSISDNRILFATRHLGFLIDGPYGRGFFRSLSDNGEAFDDEYGVVPIPLGNTGRNETILLGHILAVSKRSEQAEQAYKLIDHMTSDEDTLMYYYNRTGTLPAMKDLLHRPVFFDDPYSGVFVRQLATATTSLFQNSLFPQALPFLSKVIASAVFDDRNPEEELNFLQRIIDLLPGNII